MILTVERDILASALNVAKSRANGKLIPILGHALLAGADDQLRITAHDTEASIEIDIKAEIERPGRAALPLTELAALVGNLSKGAQLHISCDGRHAEIKSGRSRYKLPILPSEDFPQAFYPENAHSVTLTGPQIQRLFGHLAPFTTESERIYLSGAFFHGDNAGIGSCVTDGRRLVKLSTPVEWPKDARAVIVPRRAMADICKVGEGGGELSWSDRLFLIQAGNTRLCCKLIDGTFPDYTRIVPEARGSFVEFERTEIIGALNCLNSLTSEVGDVTLDWGADPVEIQLSTQTQKGEGCEVIACSGEAPKDGSITVNPRDVIAILSALTSKRLRLYQQDQSSPMLFSDPDDPTMAAVNMPVRRTSVAKSEAA